MRTARRRWQAGRVWLVLALVAGVLFPTVAGAQGGGRTVDLRVLVITGDAETDAGLQLMVETMEALSIPHDVLDSGTTDLTEDMLFDGNRGFYNGIILTDAELFIPPDTSGFTDPEWRILHQYERDFGVGESVLSGSPSEVSQELNYGLDEVRSAPEVTGRWVGPAGDSLFEYARTDAPLDITTFTVLTRPSGSAGTTVTPVLVDDANPDDILIARVDYDDGRRVLFSGITSATFLLHGQALAYEFIRFATEGLHLGAHRQYLSIHVDDLFLSSPLWDDTIDASNFETLYRNTPEDVANVAEAQRRLAERFDTLGVARWELAFNAAGSPLVDDGSLGMVADATVSPTYPNRRYGESGVVRAGDDHAMLLWFDARPPDTDAGTVLRLARTDTGPVAGTVCPLTEPWDESTVTWVDAGVGVPWSSGTPTVEESLCLSFDLASATDPIEIRTLIDWWVGGADNNGVIVELDRGSLTAPSREGGSGAVLYHGTAPTLPDPLTDQTLASQDDLSFINHTFTHRDLDASNGTGNPEALFEIARNRQAWIDLGLPGYHERLETLVTGQHSGLSEDQGTFADTSDDIVFPEGANPALLDAMEELGVRFTASDQSRPGQNRDAFVPQRDIIILPRWPANVFFDAQTTEQLTAEYNFLFNENYLAQGLDPCTTPGAICEPRTYEEIVEAEADRALLRLLSGRRWPHYFHITNIGIYDGQSATLLEDWIDALVRRYEEYMVLPIDSPVFHEVADMAEAGIAVQDGAVDAVLDLDAGTVTVTSDRSVVLEITGVEGGRPHGGQLVRSVPLAVDSPVELTVASVGSAASAPATAVVTIDQARPTHTGDGARAMVSGGGTATEALLAFDGPAIPAGDVIALTLGDVRGAGGSVEVCAVAQAWSPTDATWNALGGLSGDGCVDAELAPGAVGRVDVSALAEQLRAGSGLVLRADEGLLSFAATGADAPVLVVATGR